MKKFPFLLLDAGPIIKLFELNLWDDFIQQCDIHVSKIVADEAKYASREFEDIRIDLEPYAEKNQIEIFDLNASEVADFYKNFDIQYKSIMHPGEKETLAFLSKSHKDWLLCSADSVVFKVLGLLGRPEQGISLEEVLQQMGRSQQFEWRFTKKFREHYTEKGQVDSIQDKGLAK